MGSAVPTSEAAATQRQALQPLPPLGNVGDRWQRRQNSSVLQGSLENPGTSGETVIGKWGACSAALTHKGIASWASISL